MAGCKLAPGWSLRVAIAVDVVVAGCRRQQRPGNTAGEAAEPEVLVAMSWFTEMVKQGKAGVDREAGPPGFKTEGGGVKPTLQARTRSLQETQRTMALVVSQLTAFTR
ncbi:unnamed protein product [Coccothraustes coccothraustes]